MTATIRKRNLLILVGGLHIGGAEIVIKHLVHSIDRRLFNVTVCCIRAAGMIGEELSHEGVDVVVLKDVQARRASFLTAIKLRRLIRQRRIDVVHSHTTDALADAAVCRLAVPGLKLIHTFHFGNYPNADRSNLRVERIFWRMANRLVAVGEVQRQQIQSTFGIENDVIRTVWNGVPQGPAKSDGSFRARLECERRVLIGTIATLTPQKGLADLLKVAHRLRDIDERAFFVIVGDGPLRGELESMRNQLELEDCVAFVGWINNASTQALPDFDVFFQPSLWEAMSIAVLEAMMAGRAIVATRVGENCRIVEHEVDGLLVDAGDVEGITHTLARVIGDERLRAKLGQAAAQKALEHFTADRMTRSYEAIYQE